MIYRKTTFKEWHFSILLLDLSAKMFMNLDLLLSSSQSLPLSYLGSGFLVPKTFEILHNWWPHPHWCPLQRMEFWVIPVKKTTCNSIIGLKVKGVTDIHLFCELFKCSLRNISPLYKKLLCWPWLFRQLFSFVLHLRNKWLSIRSQIPPQWY